MHLGHFSLQSPVRTVVAVGAAVASTAIGAAAGVSAADEPARPTYHNTLAPVIRDGRTVDSCADPVVLRDQREPRLGWTMMCTSDPLDDSEVAGQDKVVRHPIPTMRSDDLVHWRYVGDALPHPPDWAAPGAFLWAPDLVYSHATDRYYLTFAVTDTDDSLRGPGACASTSDSAIGVAVSDSPTGPWEVADAPLVPPRRDPQSTCSFFWTYDPDVLGDSVGDSSVLYYGSYYGGVQAMHVSFRPDGATTTGAPTQITIPNRYEGTNVIHRGGWYWLFGSATNCCNGPLTSYGVFTGRSRDPMGPFVDRYGHSLLAGRVGGTPVLLPNGNRWVGTGHNTVFQDAKGKWWTIYHAVDRHDPYFTNDPGFTKRPALLDPLDWVSGWPQVRAGRWASDETMPAPAATQRQPSRYHPEPVGPLQLGQELPAYSDDFESGLDEGWHWIREPSPTTYGVEDGAFRFDTQAKDLYVDSNNASVLARPAPAGDFVVQTRVMLNLPPEGCCFNYVQAGIVLRAADNGDDAFVKLAHVSIWETRQTEWAKEVPPPVPPKYPRYGNGVVGPPGDVTWLRIAVDRRPGEDHYTAYTSDDGEHWVRGGTWTHELGPNQEIGLVSMGGSGFIARFLDVTTWELR